MKKKMSIVLCMLLVIGMLAGCGTEKYDTSGPFTFQEPGTWKNVTLTAPEAEPAEDEASEPAEESIQDDVDTVETVLPLAPEEAVPADAEDFSAESPAAEDVSMPETVSENPGPAAAGTDAIPEEASEENADSVEQLLVPYSLSGDEEVQRYESPAAEAEALEAENRTAAEAVLPTESEEPAWVPDEADIQFAEDVFPQTFAVVMTYWDSFYDEDTAPYEPEFAWNAAGWYAAWLYRSEGIDLLSAESVEAFLESIGCVEFDVSAAGLEDYMAPRLMRSSTGAVGYDFEWHKFRIDELLGSSVELAVEPAAESAVNALLTQHYDGGMQTERNFTLTYGVHDEAESEFDWVLRSVTLPELAPDTDPALTFAWAEVEEANRLENLLSVYPSVRVYSKEYPENGNTWLFQREGRPVLIAEGPGYCSGQFRGCWFDYDEDETGVTRARIGAFDREAGNWDALNDYLLTEFRDAGALRLDRIENDLIWADCLYRGGYRQKAAFDRDTLVLRELLVLSEDGEVLGSNCYDYSEAAPEFSFLDSWEKELRTVTVTWEDYSAGVQNRQTETHEIPADWEYLPYEGRWGDYTVYNNDRYLGAYQYPGDGEDYELFLTTIKG